MTTEQPKKVYCENCTKLDKWDWERTMTYIEHTPFTKVERYYDARIKNSNNQCEDYEEIQPIYLFKPFWEWLIKKFK